MNNIVKKNITCMINSLKKSGSNINILVTIISLMILMVDYDIPNNVASLIDNNITIAILYLTAASLFLCASPLVAILALIAVQRLINCASLVTGSSYLKELNYSEKTKAEYIESLDHNDAVTLEEEMVETRAPMVMSDPILNSNYKPVLEETYNATELSEI